METVIDGPVTEDLVWLPADDPSAAGAARRLAVDLGGRLGFPPARVAEIAIVATELASNLHHHGGGGTMLIRRLHRMGTTGMQLLALDTGPGMGNSALSARDGESSRGTLGVGLGAIERLSSSYDIWSAPGQGTVLAVSFWPGGEPSLPVPVEGLTRPMTGQSECGDAWSVRAVDGGIQVMLADGLGHGPLAAAASRLATEAFTRAPAGAGPAATLEVMHRAMGQSRGAAVSVAEIDPGRGLTVAGLGNISVWIDGGSQRRAAISMPGIAGHQAPSFRQHQYELAPDSLVVLHSDGLSDKWALSDYAGLRRRTPAVIAGVLLRDAGVHRDDASVAVIRP